MTPQGMTRTRLSILSDQFLSFGVNVRATRYFCNPVEKVKVHSPPPTTFPIVDPLLHYTCYHIQPKPNANEERIIFNQFVEKGDELKIRRRNLSARQLSRSTPDR